MSLFQARGLSWGGDHRGWVPSPIGDNLLGDDFTSVGLTRNPGLSADNFSKQHFMESGSLLPKKKEKKSFGFAKLTFSDTRKHVVKKLPNHSAGNMLFAISPQGWNAGVLKCYYSPGNCESACPHPQQILVGRALKSLETQQLLPCGVSINPLTLISGLVKCGILANFCQILSLFTPSPSWLW